MKVGRQQELEGHVRHPRRLPRQTAPSGEGNRIRNKLWFYFEERAQLWLSASHQENVHSFYFISNNGMGVTLWVKLNCTQMKAFQTNG